MNPLTPDMKMADVIHSNYLLIPVINRFGIPSGYGDATVRLLCKKHGIDIGFFLDILNAFSRESYRPAKILRTSNVLMIVDYLEKTHSYYIENLLPTIERLIAELIEYCPKNNRSLNLVKKFFEEYKNELLAHFKREETVTFPYIKKVYKVHISGGAGIKEKKELSRYSMRVYEEEHSDVDENLYDLKNILIKYIRGEVDDTIRNAVIFELFRLEKDIKDHTRIENNILRPLVVEMEKTLLRTPKRKPGIRRMENNNNRYEQITNEIEPPYAVSDPSEQIGTGIPLQTKNNPEVNHENLSRRELEVLKLVAQGLMNKQIADRLSISMHTVISHRKNITSKLGIKTIPGLTMYALLNGLITVKEELGDRR